MIDHNGRRLRLNRFNRNAVGNRFRNNALTHVRKLRVIVPVCKTCLHRILHKRVNRRIDPIAAGPQLVFIRNAVCAGIRNAVRLHPVRNHIIHAVLDEIRHFVHLGILGCFNDRHVLLHRGLILFERNLIVFIHALQNRLGSCNGVLFIRILIASVFFPIIIQTRIVSIRVLGQAGNQSAFADGQLAEFLSEIIPRGGLYAVIGSAEVHIVEIRFQDIILLHNGFKLQRKKRLLNFPLIRALSAQNLVFDQLLGNCAAAGGIAVSEHFKSSGKQTFEIHAVVFIKPNVLHGNESVSQHFRNLIDVRPIAVLDGRHGHDFFPVSVIQV